MTPLKFLATVQAVLFLSTAAGLAHDSSARSTGDAARPAGSAASGLRLTQDAADPPPAPGTDAPSEAGGSLDPGVALSGLAGPYLAARAAAMQSDFVAAAQWYGRLLKQDPKDPVLQDSTLVALISAGQVDQAVGLATAMAGEGQATPLSTIVVRAERARTGSWDELLADLETLDSPADLSGGALLDEMIRAWALLGSGRATDAMAAFAALEESEGAAAMARYHLGLARATVGDYEGADAAMTQTGTGAHLLGVTAHAQVLSQLDRNDDAVAMIDELGGIEAEPALVDLRARLAAGETLPFTAVRSPTDGIAQVFLTFAGALSGGPDPDPLALLHARLAAHLAPDLGEARLMVAQLLQEVGQFDLAEREFTAMRELGELRPVAELAQIDALVRAERMEDAERAARALTEAQPRLAPAWTALGDLLRQQEKWTEAVAAYDRAIEILADDPDPQASWFALYARGIALERSGEFDRADADMRAALELQPDQAPVLNYLGYSWVERNVNLDEALKLIERAVELRPDDGYILDSLAWAYYRQGRFEEAVAPMERAVAAMSDDSLVNDHMGDIYWKVGRRREAEIQWQRALSLWKEADTDTDRDRIRAKLAVGLDAVLEAEAANGGKLPEGFAEPPAEAEEATAEADGAAGTGAGEDASGAPSDTPSAADDDADPDRP
ncbi:tetratricopeptide repeat protein [uncultured Paracoccus sp.]|uniref:tetratricopeptide repeat protein n=1 Tax=uncultured Paracoccus sp. TaxID=189685 RepID=UPI00261DBD58|nr:tetratricopeptide repeat protein [uncultured Paracoccus sp.]